MFKDEDGWTKVTFLELIFIGILAIFYITFVLTVCIVTFRKGYIALGLVGFFVPVLWLVGAVLPARAGSSYRLEKERLAATPSP
jgi:uncharacterized membrane protein YjjP (DUF1212 family)